MSLTQLWAVNSHPCTVTLFIYSQAKSLYTQNGYRATYVPFLRSQVNLTLLFCKGWELKVGIHCDRWDLCLNFKPIWSAFNFGLLIGDLKKKKKSALANTEGNSPPNLYHYTVHLQKRYIKQITGKYQHLLYDSG